MCTCRKSDKGVTYELRGQVSQSKEGESLGWISSGEPAMEAEMRRATASTISMHTSAQRGSNRCRCVGILSLQIWPQLQLFQQVKGDLKL